jgi:hypothetical protein
MASITYWNRLEPRPVAPSIDEALAARLRDPLWLLTRQWQFGEFQGADAGSPAYVTVATTCTPISAWRAGSGPWQPLDGRTPAEPLIQGEPLDAADLSLQVEIALAFERMLRARPDITAQAADAVIAVLRGALPLAQPPAADRDGTSFFAVCAPRSFDGVALYAASAANPPALPTGVVIDPGSLTAVQGAQASLAAWVAGTYGPIGDQDPPAWREDRLEYDAGLAARPASGDETDFAVHPELDGAIDWYALDVAAPAPAGDEAKAALPARDSAAVTSSVLPINVRFRGMPNARWWDFEDSRTDFGDLRPDLRDAATLVVMDYMLLHGNDWFVVPFDQPAGSACRVDSLVVRDVFGGLTGVPRADRGGAPVDGRWTLFTSSVAGAPQELGAFLVLPPSAATSIQRSDALEEVHFFRDEMANMIWAVESVVTGAAGAVWPGAERSTAIAPAPAAPAAGAALRYVIQTPVPYNWIPFLPVTIDPAAGAIVLERAALLDVSRDPPTPVAPVGRILRPHGGTDPYRIREEEISRAGVHVRRVFCRARWTDGSTWLWTARERLAGAGQGASGLQFDRAVQAD